MAEETPVIPAETQPMEETNQEDATAKKILEENPVEEGVWVADKKADAPVSGPISKSKEGYGGISDSSSGEELSQAVVNLITSKSIEMIQHCQKKLDDQKVGSLSMSYMLMKIQETLDVYIYDYLPKLNVFLTEADRITAEYYADMCSQLPKYGDYLAAIEAHEAPMVDAGGASQISKGNLYEVVKQVVDSYYGAALHLKSGRSVLTNINSTNTERCVMLDDLYQRMPKWLMIQNDVTNQLDCIRDEACNITAFIDFLRHGEVKTELNLDVSSMPIISGYF